MYALTRATNYTSSKPVTIVDKNSIKEFKAGLSVTCMVTTGTSGQQKVAFDNEKQQSNQRKQRYMISVIFLCKEIQTLAF